MGGREGRDWRGGEHPRTRRSERRKRVRGKCLAPKFIPPCCAKPNGATSLLRQRMWHDRVGPATRHTIGRSKTSPWWKVCRAKAFGATQCFSCARRFGAIKGNKARKYFARQFFIKILTQKRIKIYIYIYIFLHTLFTHSRPYTQVCVIPSLWA